MHNFLLTSTCHLAKYQFIQFNHVCHVEIVEVVHSTIVGSQVSPLQICSPSGPKMLQHLSYQRSRCSSWLSELPITCALNFLLIFLMVLNLIYGLLVAVCMKWLLIVMKLMCCITSGD